MVSGDKVDRAVLQQVGQLLASILLPGLVTIVCHAECLGAWATLWEPCKNTWSFQSRKHPRAIRGVDTDPADFYAAIDLVSRSDICSLRWHMGRRKCVEAVTERLA
eukprot:4393732-Amphidinium_carterae.1